jgi:hypothetical protein
VVLDLVVQHVLEVPAPLGRLGEEGERGAEDSPCLFGASLCLQQKVRRAAVLTLPELALQDLVLDPQLCQGVWSFVEVDDLGEVEDHFGEVLGRQQSNFSCQSVLL